MIESFSVDEATGQATLDYPKDSSVTISLQ